METDKKGILARAKAAAQESVVVTCLLYTSDAADDP